MLVQMPQHQGHTVQKAANHTACPNTAKTRRESHAQLGMLEHATQKLCGQPAHGIPGQRGTKRLRQGQGRTRRQSLALAAAPQRRRPQTATPPARGACTHTRALARYTCKGHTARTVTILPRQGQQRLFMKGSVDWMH